MSRWISACLFAILGPSSIAHAQFGSMGPGSTRPISVVVSGGLTVPSADLGDFHDPGLHFDASLIFNIPGFPIALRPEFSLTRFKLKGPSPVSAPNADDVTNMTAFLGNIEVPLGGGLYVLAGGGLLSLSTADGLGVTDESSRKFTFNAGAGWRFALGSMRGFLEARVGAASYDEGKVGFSKAQFIPVTFGLVF